MHQTLKIGSELTLEITRLGHRGDGIGLATTASGPIPVYIPYTLPGERVIATIAGKQGDGYAGKLKRILEGAAHRAAPVCPHFSLCGGCNLQHLSDDAYRTWKQDRLLTALRQRGFTGIDLNPMIMVPPNTRRRAQFVAYRRGDQVLLGFHEARSHFVVDIADCPVMHPVIMDLMADLRAALAQTLGAGETADLLVTATESGADIFLSLSAPLTLSAREAWAAMARHHPVARIMYNRGRRGEDEILLLNHPPTVRFADIAVALPPEPFLQPTIEGEAAMQRLVLEAVTDADRIADLFSGCGTFALPASRKASVHAIDSQDAAIKALAQAAAKAGLAARVSVQTRDLMRQPLSAQELSSFDAVVFDPPRAGARAQAMLLAQSTIPVLVAVSCDPASLARDLRILVDGGYRIDSLTPVDQFLWSDHVEAVAILSR